jgi:transposase
MSSTFQSHRQTLRAPEISRASLTDWPVRGEACLNPELQRFAEGNRRDEAAVHAAVTQPWSNGPVEGHVNRLKTVKR